MKKTYKAPITTAILMTSESVLAGSLPVDGTKTVTDPTNILSHKKAYSSENWNTEEEE